MLMRIFPSLNNGVQILDKWGHLPTIGLNDSVKINIVHGMENIENVVCGYLFDGNDWEITQVSIH